MYYDEWSTANNNNNNNNNNTQPNHDVVAVPAWATDVEPRQPWSTCSVPPMARPDSCYNS